MEILWEEMKAKIKLNVQVYSVVWLFLLNK